MLAADVYLMKKQNQPNSHQNCGKINKRKLSNKRFSLYKNGFSFILFIFFVKRSKINKSLSREANLDVSTEAGGGESIKHIQNPNISTKLPLSVLIRFS